MRRGVEYNGEQWRKVVHWEEEWVYRGGFRGMEISHASSPLKNLQIVAYAKYMYTMRWSIRDSEAKVGINGL